MVISNKKAKISASTHLVMNKVSLKHKLRKQISFMEIEINKRTIPYFQKMSIYFKIKSTKTEKCSNSAQ